MLNLTLIALAKFSLHSYKLSCPPTYINVFSSSVFNMTNENPQTEYDSPWKQILQFERKQQKLVLVRRLYEQGFEREDIINLFGFIDRMLSLPIELEQEFWQEIRNFEESKRMQYITSVERIGFQKGIEQSQNQIKQVLLKSISLGLKLKFGETDQNLLAEIEAIQDTSVLETILEAIDTASTVSQLRQIYQLPATDT